MRTPRTIILCLGAAALATACSSSGDDADDVASTTVSAAPSTNAVSTSGASTTTAVTTAPPSTAPAPSTAPSTSAPASLTDADLAGWLAEDMPTLTNSPGQMLTVLAPGVDASAAAGTYPDGRAVSADDEFRIASVTKTFTAAAVMRLVETGRLALDTSLADSGASDDLLALVRADGYDVDAITIEHLLAHTSGIFDYAFGPGSTYATVATSDPDRTWTRADQVRFAIDEGDPMGAPGEVFHYSDTGYVLLGDIIERTHGTDLGTAYAELLRFDELGLDHTYLELPGTEPRAHRATQRFGDVDATGFDATIDLYGGGGLVSTTHDLAVFFEAFGRGEVFDDPATLDALTVAGPDPGAGRGVFLTAIGDAPCLLHDGFWGVQAITCPTLGLTLTRSHLQVAPVAEWDPGAVYGQVLDALGIAS